MGMIRRADLDQIARQGAVMNLDDLRARGEAIIAHACGEAERIIADAKAERERLLSGAEEQGRSDGYERGLRDGAEEGRRRGLEEARRSRTEAIDGVCQGWTRALEAFETARESMLSAAREEVVALSIEIAERVVRRAIANDPSVVLAQLEAVLDAVTRPARLCVRVHPDDLELARSELPGILERFERCRHAELLADASLERGSCVATTEDGGRIDAGIGSQLARIVSELLPDRGASGTLRVDAESRSDAA